MRSLPLILLAACGADDPTGIWLFQSPLSEVESTCDTTHGENYVYGQWPEDDDGSIQSDWTYTEENSFGDELAFAQIETMGKDEAIILLGDTVVPGTWDKNNQQWVFTWADEQSSEDGEAHSAGYSFLLEEQSSATLELRFGVIEPGYARGQISNSSVGRTTWTETDVWDAATVGVSYSQIPSTTYLEGTDESVTSVDNAPTSSDCEDSECNLWFQTTCAQDDDFTATLTGYEEDGTFDYLQYASQPGD